MKEKYGYIYLSYDIVHLKFYIGQKKSKEFVKSYKGSGVILKDVMKKYGKDIIKTEILEWCYNKDDLNECEKKWIWFFNAIKDEQFYNLCEGGFGTGGHHPSDETKNKISESLKGKFTGEKSAWYGRKHTEESKKKISENHADINGGKHPLARKIICVNTLEIFESMMDIERKYNIDNVTICQCCQGTHLHAKELLWMYYDDYLNEDLRKQRIYNYENRNIIYSEKIKKGRKNKFPSTAKKVICLNNLKIFDSVSKAAKECNTYRSGIERSCEGTSNSSGKNPFTNEQLIWMYYDDYTKNKDNEELIKSKLSKKTNKNSSKQIICLNNLEIFNTISAGANKYHLDASALAKCCKNKCKTCGKDLITGEPLKWMYYKDYLKNKN